MAVRLTCAETYAVTVPPTTSRIIKPMKATSRRRTRPPDDDGWAYEIKWDGMRAIGFVADGTLRLQTSNGLDATERFPELAPTGRPRSCPTTPCSTARS